MTTSNPFTSPFFERLPSKSLAIRDVRLFLKYHPGDPIVVINNLQDELIFQTDDLPVEDVTEETALQFDKHNAILDELKTAVANPNVIAMVNKTATRPSAKRPNSGPPQDQPAAKRAKRNAPSNTAVTTAASTATAIPNGSLPAVVPSATQVAAVLQQAPATPAPLPQATPSPAAHQTEFIDELEHVILNEVGGGEEEEEEESTMVVSNGVSISTPPFMTLEKFTTVFSSLKPKIFFDTLESYTANRGTTTYESDQGHLTETYHYLTEIISSDASTPHALIKTHDHAKALVVECARRTKPITSFLAQNAPMLDKLLVAPFVTELIKKCGPALTVEKILATAKMESFPATLEFVAVCIVISSIAEPLKYVTNKALVQKFVEKTLQLSKK